MPSHLSVRAPEQRRVIAISVASEVTNHDIIIFCHNCSIIKDENMDQT